MLRERPLAAPCSRWLAVAKQFVAPTLCWREQVRTIGSAGEGPDASCVGSLTLRLFGWREPTGGDSKDWPCHAGPMVRILFAPAGRWYGAGGEENGTIVAAS